MWNSFGFHIWRSLKASMIFHCAWKLELSYVVFWSFGAACLWIVPSIEVHHWFPCCMWWICGWMFWSPVLSVCHRSPQISLSRGVEDWKLASVHSTICGQAYYSSRYPLCKQVIVFPLTCSVITFFQKVDFREFQSNKKMKKFWGWPVSLWSTLLPFLPLPAENYKNIEKYL